MAANNERMIDFMLLRILVINDFVERGRKNFENYENLMDELLIGLREGRYVSLTYDLFWIERYFPHELGLLRDEKIKNLEMLMKEMFKKFPDKCAIRGLYERWDEDEKILNSLPN